MTQLLGHTLFSPPVYPALCERSPLCTLTQGRKVVQPLDVAEDWLFRSDDVTIEYSLSSH